MTLDGCADKEMTRPDRILSFVSVHLALTAASNNSRKQRSRDCNTIERATRVRIDLMKLSILIPVYDDLQEVESMIQSIQALSGELGAEFLLADLRGDWIDLARDNTRSPHVHWFF